MIILLHLAYKRFLSGNIFYFKNYLCPYWKHHLLKFCLIVLLHDMICAPQAKIFVLRLLCPFVSSRKPSPLLCIWHCICELHMVSSRTKLWLSPLFFSFSCSQCEVPMTVRHVLQLIRNVFCDANGRLQCMPWAVTWRCPANWRALHDLEAQGKESAAASSTVGPWVRGILSFNNVLIYKSHAFFPAWLIVKE